MAPKNLLNRLDKYGLGKARPLAHFLEMSGIDVPNKQTHSPSWCTHGEGHKYSLKDTLTGNS